MDPIGAKGPRFPWVIALYYTDEKHLLLKLPSLALTTMCNLCNDIRSIQTQQLKNCKKLAYVTGTHYAQSLWCYNIIILFFFFFFFTDEPNQLENDHLVGCECHWSRGNEQNVVLFHRNSESLRIFISHVGNFKPRNPTELDITMIGHTHTLRMNNVTTKMQTVKQLDVESLSIRKTSHYCLVLIMQRCNYWQRFSFFHQDHLTFSKWFFLLKSPYVIPEFLRGQSKCCSKAPFKHLCCVIVASAQKVSRLFWRESR